MKIIRKLLSFSLLLSILVATLSLAGCHGQKVLPEFSVPDEFDTEKQYEIVFWSKNEKNPTQVAAYQKIISDFEALYPNIKVTLVHYNDYTKIYEDVINNVATRKTPNVCITYPDHIATYLSGTNLVVPLDELIADEKYGLGGSQINFDGVEYEEIIPKFMQEGVINGTQYALPFMRSTEVCYINKTLLEKFGFSLPETLTWEYIWEVSEACIAKTKELGKIKVKNESGREVEVWAATGQPTFIPFIYKSTDNMMISMLEQLDAPYSNDDGDILIFNDTTKGILYDLSTHIKSGAFNTFQKIGYPADYINKGQAIFGIDSTAGATWMGYNAPQNKFRSDFEDFEMVVMPLPQYDTGNPKMISQGPSLCLFNKEDPQEVLASWIFAQFLLTNDAQISYSQTEGYLPVTSKAIDSKEYQDYLAASGTDNELHYSIKLDAIKIFIDNINNSFTTPVFNGSTSLRSVAGELIEEVRKGTDRKKEINDAFMTDLFNRMQVLKKLDQLTGGKGLTQLVFTELPIESKILIGTLCTAWLSLGIYGIVQLIKKKKE